MWLLLMACSGNNDSDTAPPTFAGGNFRFTVEGSNDTCLSGGLSEAWLQDSYPQDLPQPLFVPAETDLPSSYSVLLPSPFGSFSVTTKEGAAAHSIETDGTYPALAFDSAEYPDCTADLSLAAYLTETSTEDLEGTATLRLGPFTGSDCPTVPKDPCDVYVDLVAHRL